jgi:hypothetical protein
MNLPLEVLVVCIAFLGFNCLRVDAILLHNCCLIICIYLHHDTMLGA